MYFTDRGIEELEKRRGDEEVTLAWLAEQLRDFVDVHPEHKVTGVELILTRLHSGAKFSDKTYKFSGGLHGVGVSVVNALSSKLEVTVWRDATEYAMTFKGGERTGPLKKVGDAPKSRSGTLVRFWPDPKYFDTPKFLLAHLKQVLRAKAVLCPNLRVGLDDQVNNEQIVWQYENGLVDYLKDALNGLETLPAEPFVGHFKGDREEADWALLWVHGEADQLAAYDSAKVLLEKVGGSELTARSYPEAAHEVFNEINSGEVLDEVAAFLARVA